MSIRLLIVGSDREEDGISVRFPGRALIWGLEQRGIHWDVYLPGTTPMPDLRAYDAVLCWTYIVWRTIPAYMPGALQIEAHARALGIPVINRVEHGGAGHSFFLKTWLEHGTPCARSQSFESFDEILLDYPVLLRRTGVHKGEDLFLVQTPEEARELVRERKRDATKKALDLAIEFVDVRDEHGLYNRYRIYVVGDRIIPISVLFSRHWLVNYGEFVDDELATRYSREFMQKGEQNVDEVLAAARQTGSDIVSLDYAKRSDGRYIFWEANRHFMTLEDYGQTPSGRFFKATGIDAEGRQQVFETLGLALGDLVIERAREATRQRMTPVAVGCNK